MKNVTLGSTGITVPQNGFGALPVQRADMGTAVKILRAAYDGGMRFFDTAHAYSDSEEKIGRAFGDTVFKTDRDKIFIATKGMCETPEELRAQLDQSLRSMKTDYVDIYQFHCAGRVYRPGDGTGMYEAMLEFKEKGLIKHIGITAHKIGIAEEAIESGLYETLQFPMSYLSTEREIALIDKCIKANMGFICMKGLAGGLITNAQAAGAFTLQFENTVPIWGIQKMSELNEWLSFFEKEPEMTDEIKAFIEKEKKELDGEFCRGCGYCMPCPMGITINQCARMSLMIRRAPTGGWLSEHWQAEMKKIETCLNCGKCKSKCPYELDTPNLLKKNYEDYKKVISGEISVGYTE